MGRRERRVIGVSEDPQLDLQRIYGERFSGDAANRQRIWQVLCEEWFQRYIPADSTVLEIAVGQCEFINTIKAGRKIAVDLNEDAREWADPDVELHITSSTDLEPVTRAEADIVFLSNFLEHLTHDDIWATLAECHRVLRPGGRLLILGPNIRYCLRDFWMFCDHKTPIDDRALTEMLTVSGFEIEEVYPRFLPYTTKSQLPSSPWLVRAYLKFPLIWRVLGGQAFVIARR